MNKPLPGASNAMTFGILSIVLTILCCGPFGAIFSFIGLSNARKANDAYMQNPEEYTGHENVKTAKILSYIGMALAAAYLLFIILYFGVLAKMIYDNPNFLGELK